MILNVSQHRGGGTREHVHRRQDRRRRQRPGTVPAGASIGGKMRLRARAEDQGEERMSPVVMTHRWS